MDLEWEQRRPAARAALAVPGALLGAALGADCLAAAAGFGDVPLVLCGAAPALLAVWGGALLAGRRDRAAVLAALPWALGADCLGHQLAYALETAPGDPAGVLGAFLRLADLPGRYWIRLACLLAASLLVWGVLLYRAGREERLLARALQPVRSAWEPAPADMEFYLPDPAWIRPHRLVRGICPGIWLGVLCLCLWMGRLTGREALWNRGAAGTAFSMLLIVSCLELPGRLCAGAGRICVRQGGQLWQIPLKRILDPELRVSLARELRLWDRLPQARRTAFRAMVSSVIAGGKLEDCRLGSPGLVQESPWEWSLSDRKYGFHLIPKVYPNFTPAPGEAERLTAAPPLRRRNPIVAAVFLAVCLGAGLYTGVLAERRPAPPPPEVPGQEAAGDPAPDPAPAGGAAVPERVGEYLLNGLTLRTDGDFQAGTSGFTDPESGAFYQLELRFGVEEEAARIALEETDGTELWRLRPEDGGFLWGLGENGTAYRYDLRTVRLPEGRLSHTGVARSERGTMLILTCVHGEELPEETARGTMLYMLENLEFTGPAVTEENYQDQLRPAVSMGFNYCGQAFFKAPEGMFPYEAYLDTFLPCGGEVTYYDGGISMMTEAHGLRVSAAVIPHGGTALDVVREAYEDLKAAGRQYDERNYLEDAYNEEGNNACRVAVYYEGGRTRVTALTAVEKWEGCYLFRELTCLPEKMDGEYRAVFQEMEKVCGVTISVMEDLGSQQRAQEEASGQ